MKSVSGVDDYSYQADHSIVEKLKDDFKVYKEKRLS